MPRPSATNAPVCGMSCSGVAVATTRRSIASGVIPACLIAAAPAANADPIADFYKGKSLRMLIGYGPGGGYDIYGRLAAEFLGKFIPGNPTLVPENMPGNSSLKVVGYGIGYDLNLFSNFTYFLDDPVNGDQFHQADHRFVTGAAISHRRLGEWAGIPNCGIDVEGVALFQFQTRCSPVDQPPNHDVECDNYSVFIFVGGAVIDPVRKIARPHQHAALFRRNDDKIGVQIVFLEILRLQIFRELAR